MSKRKVLKPAKHGSVTPEIAKAAVLAIKGVPDRPDSVALITAIENAIDEIATDKMTQIEVLGVLDLVGKRFYEDCMS